MVAVSVPGVFRDTLLEPHMPAAIPAHLLKWKHRDACLKLIPRYKRLPVMYYRDTDYEHSIRVEFFVDRDARHAQEFYPDFRVKLAKLRGRYHDDHEIAPFHGDVPLQRKLFMTPAEKQELRELEIAAAEYMARIYPKRIEGYHFLDDIMFPMILKDDREAQFVSFHDKRDAFGEAAHEYFAGNRAFDEPYANYILDPFGNLPQAFPLIKEMFSEKSPFRFPPVQTVGYFEGGYCHPEPHTLETLARNSGVPFYEDWKQTVKGLFGEPALLTQREFYPWQVPQPASAD